MDNKTKIIFGLAAACCLLVGILIGILIARPFAGKTVAEKEAVDTVSVESETVKPVEEKKVEEEKTYGYYPTFYVKRLYYSVSASEGDHTIKVYTDGSAHIAKAVTNTRWLEEAKLERGGNFFHVKENKESESRKGELYIQDEQGRKITIYVTQRGR